MCFLIRESTENESHSFGMISKVTSKIMRDIICDKSQMGSANTCRRWRWPTRKLVRTGHSLFSIQRPIKILRNSAVIEYFCLNLRVFQWSRSAGKNCWLFQQGLNTPRRFMQQKISDNKVDFYFPSTAPEEYTGLQFKTRKKVEIWLVVGNPNSKFWWWIGFKIITD